MFRCYLLVLSILIASPARAEMPTPATTVTYKCQEEEVTVFSDEPCGDGAEKITIEVLPGNSTVQLHGLRVQELAVLEQIDREFQALEAKRQKEKEERERRARLAAEEERLFQQRLRALRRSDFTYGYSYPVPYRHYKPSRPRHQARTPWRARHKPRRQYRGARLGSNVSPK